jgi:YhcH/YjgK/YiaL family protein
LYSGLGERIAIGLALLNEERVLHAPVGRYEVQGKDIFFVADEVETKPASEGRFEIHRKYLDIQCVVSGTEYIGYTPLEGLTEVQAYDGDKDIAFYAGTAVHSKAVLRPGLFAIFWPNEPHMPCRTIETPCRVKKIVVKIRME